MDLRVQRTKRSIINAFIELRAKKPLEKISVKELSEIAFINKATFYTHYRDIYDLAEQLEDEAITSALNSIPHPEYLLTKPKQGLIELTTAINSQNRLFNILFSDSRQGLYVEKLEEKLKSYFYNKYPEYKNNLEKDLLFSVLIQGCFHALFSHPDDDYNTVIDILGNINECLILNYKQQL